MKQKKTEQSKASKPRDGFLDISGNGSAISQKLGDKQSDRSQTLQLFFRLLNLMFRFFKWLLVGK